MTDVNQGESMKRCMKGGWLATAALTVALTGLLFGIGGCGGGSGHSTPVAHPLNLSEMPIEAPMDSLGESPVTAPLSDSNLAGKAIFTPTSGGVIGVANAPAPK
jgi:hypothetical protein